MIKNKDVDFDSRISNGKLIRTKNNTDEIVLTIEEFQECYKRWVLPFISTVKSDEVKQDPSASWEIR